MTFKKINNHKGFPHVMFLKPSAYKFQMERNAFFIINFLFVTIANIQKVLIDANKGDMKIPFLFM